MAGKAEVGAALPPAPVTTTDINVTQNAASSVLKLH
jgi:hypothetical protein